LHGRIGRLLHPSQRLVAAANDRLLLTNLALGHALLINQVALSVHLRPRDHLQRRTIYKSHVPILANHRPASRVDKHGLLRIIALAALGILLIRDKRVR
jgi:hypothetical protein